MSDNQSSGEEILKKNENLMREKIKELPLKERVRAVALFSLYLKKIEIDKKMD